MRIKLSIGRTMPNENWHRWFAWRPVSTGTEVVFMEWVDRRFCDTGWGGNWVKEYRVASGVIK